MKFKLDENFGTRTQHVFRDAGHNVQTVREESLEGATDQRLYQVCCEEQRCLITLDLDFADVIRFPPQETGGIVVIRVPRNPTLALLERLVRQFLESLNRMSVEKKLWIVEVGRIRVHQDSG
jgi:predicted nuclease of predicted toxin-antitoxin system